MSTEVSGLRRRLASLKPPLDASPVSDLRVIHGKVGSGGTDVGDHVAEEIMLDEEACSESMSQSFSSVSSGSPDEDEVEHRHPAERVEVSNGNAKANGLAENTREKDRVRPSREGAARREEPHVSASMTRGQQRGGTSSPRAVRSPRSRSVPSKSSSWLGYDLSIIVALVSPIGNLLTGSDHIKNILLLLLLIYYLHQLVEVPWTLYRMSIPSKDFISLPKHADPAKLAVHSELRSLEFFYLVLSVISPFLGATLLRFVATSISGNPATLSWFSTSLFVLATGIRPWMHLTERLKDRSRALTAILEDRVDEEVETHDVDFKTDFDKELFSLRDKYDTLDKRFTDYNVSSEREWDDLADAIDTLETTVRRYQTEATKRTNDYDARLSVLETYVLDLHQRDRKTRMHSDGSLMRGAQLRALFWETLALPWTLSVLFWVFTSSAVKKILEDHPARIMAKPMSPSHSRFKAPALETIVEEDVQDGPEGNDILASDSTQTLVMESIQYRKDAAELVLKIALRVFVFALSPVLFTLRMILFLLDVPRMLLRDIV